MSATEKSRNSIRRLFSDVPVSVFPEVLLVFITSYYVVVPFLSSVHTPHNVSHALKIHALCSCVRKITVVT